MIGCLDHVCSDMLRWLSRAVMCRPYRNQHITNILLLIGGFDTPSAIASDYSTTGIFQPSVRAKNAKYNATEPATAAFNDSTCPRMGSFRTISHFARVS